MSVSLKSMQIPQNALATGAHPVPVDESCSNVPYKYKYRLNGICVKSIDEAYPPNKICVTHDTHYIQANNKRHLLINKIVMKPVEFK